MSHHDDFAREPIPGLPAHLPEGEELLWQGKPNAALLASNALHSRKIAVYFGALAIWSLIAGITDGRPVAEIAVSVLGTLGLGAVVLAIIWFISRAMERTTIYSITNKRVVMRFGIAIPVTFQLPFTQITSADLKTLADGHGTIALTLKEHTKISWPILWPHVRPWKLARPQPSLRAIPDVASVTELLAENLRAAHQNTVEPAKTFVSVPTKQALKPSTPIGGLDMESAG